MAKKGKSEDDDDASGADGEGTENKKVGGKKKLFIIIGLVLLLAGGGAGSYFAGLFGGGKDKKEEKKEQVEEAEDKEEGKSGKGKKDKIAKPAYLEIPEFLVNLQTGSGRPSFLKMKVVFELEKKEDVALVSAQLPKIQNVLNTYLRELRAADLSGSAGLYRLKEEVLMRSNKIVHPTQVKDVLFTDIIVQ